MELLSRLIWNSPCNGQGHFIDKRSRIRKPLIMRKALMFMLVFIGTGFMVHGQQKKPKMAFDHRLHDFGKIMEDGGKVRHTFTFTNTGSKPLVINKVNASCGCTTPQWTRQPVKPGAKGKIRVTFDPRRRPGSFAKSVVVRTNAINETVLLRIKGKVKRAQRSLKARYPRKMGAIRLKSHHLAFGNIKHNQRKTDSLGMVNVSDQPVAVDFKRVPGHIQLETQPGQIKPGEQTYIYGSYDASKVDDWGFRMDRVRVRVNQKGMAHNMLVVSSRIMENFGDLTPQERKNAPRVKFENTTHHFGTVDKGGQVSHVFRFTNTGKRPLKIRKIRATCGCTTVKPEKEVVEPGESSSFKAVLHVGSRRRQLHKSIYFIANDPKKPRTRLGLRAKVR